MLSRIVVVLVFLFMTIESGFAQSGGESQGSRLLFLPFDGSSAGKYAYLVDGIRNMLATRLASKNGVQLVDYTMQEAEIKKIVALGQKSGDILAVYNKLQTDYLVSGALYATNTGLQVQVVFSSAKTSTPQHFSTAADNEEQVIPAIGTLVEEIAQKMFQSPSPEAEKADARSDASGISGFRTEHPEKQYKKGLFGGGSIVDGEGNAGTVSAVGIKKSPVIPSVIVAMDVGDLDGDGEKEIVFASRSELQIFRFRDGRFQKIGGHALRSTFKINAINIADLDRNGKSEIYVSASEGLKVSSLIMSWADQEGIKILGEHIDWYLRPVMLPGEGMILIGQRGNSDAGQGYVAPGVYRLVVGAGFSSVSRGSNLPLPSKINLFDFVWADLDNNKTIETIAVDRREKLLVFDSQNNLLWVSTGNTGGSRNYLGPVRNETNNSDLRSPSKSQEADRVLTFVPTRLIAQDLDNDGKSEIIVGRNKLISPRFMINYREYDGGDITCLSWRESSLKEVWRTNRIPGYIADYSFFLSPAEKNSAKEQAQLYVGQVPESTFLGLLATKESKMLVYGIALPAK